jgi:DDE superfamily endonuclease
MALLQVRASRCGPNGYGAAWRATIQEDSGRATANVEMNTVSMSEFLAQVSAAHRREFIIIVVDGASSHVAKDLVVPRNVRLLRPPPYAPELNPQEHVWDELREKEFPNRVYADMASVRAQLEAGLPRLAGERKALRSLTAWPWINRLNLNAH